MGQNRQKKKKKKDECVQTGHDVDVGLWNISAGQHIQL